MKRRLNEFAKKSKVGNGSTERVSIVLIKEVVVLNPGEEKEYNVKWSDDVDDVFHWETEKTVRKFAKKGLLRKFNQQQEKNNSYLYSVEAIVDEKYDEAGVHCYLIKWEGYSSAYNSWELASKFTHFSDPIEEFRAKQMSCIQEKEYELPSFLARKDNDEDYGQRLREKMNLALRNKKNSMSSFSSSGYGSIHDFAYSSSYVQKSMETTADESQTDAFLPTSNVYGGAGCSTSTLVVTNDNDERATNVALSINQSIMEDGTETTNGTNDNVMKTNHLMGSETSDAFIEEALNNARETAINCEIDEAFTAATVAESSTTITISTSASSLNLCLSTFPGEEEYGPDEDENIAGADETVGTHASITSMSSLNLWMSSIRSFEAETSPVDDDSDIEVVYVESKKKRSEDDSFDLRL